MKHTPGPWVHDDGHIFTEEKNRKWVSIAHVYDIYKNDGTPEANGKLIAASPDLLECLQEAINGLEWFVSEYPTIVNESDYETLKKWKEVINKAITL